MTDHAEFFDTQDGCKFNSKYYGGTNTKVENELQKSTYCKGRYLNVIKDDKGAVRQMSLADPAPTRSEVCGKDPWPVCESTEKTMWQRSIQIANLHNDTTNCSFTTLSAFEYSGNNYADPKSGKTLVANMHRNVIFADDNVTEQPLRKPALAASCLSSLRALGERSR